MEARSTVERRELRNGSKAAPDGVRAQLHGMWSSVAGAWGANVDYVDARGAHVTARMLELARPAQGERVLELACGPGGPGLAAAPLVAPGGEVVQSDVSAEMTAIATARAAERGLGNVTGRVLDLEEIDEPDDAYDVVLCREGLMLVPDPARAAREIGRVLRPGGRAVLTVWGPRARNPWLAVVFDVVGAHLGAPMPPRGSRTRSRSTIPPGSAACLRRPACPMSMWASCRPVRRRLGGRMVGADVHARGAARQEARCAPRRSSPGAPRPSSRPSPSTRHRRGSRSLASRWSHLPAPDASPSGGAEAAHRQGFRSLIESVTHPHGAGRRSSPSVERCGAR